MSVLIKRQNRYMKRCYLTRLANDWRMTYVVNLQSIVPTYERMPTPAWKALLTILYHSTVVASRFAFSFNSLNLLVHTKEYFIPSRWAAYTTKRNYITSALVWLSYLLRDFSWCSLAGIRTLPCRVN